MSDAQYRLLIQRSFDEELNKQEHRALMEHLETSESGAKFHHQLDQMIQAAQDTPLPDELRPQTPEALARMIMEQLPQKKGSIFGFLGSIFGGLSKGQKPAAKGKGVLAGKGGKQAKAEPQDEEEEETSGKGKGGMKFPKKKPKEIDHEAIESQVGSPNRFNRKKDKSQDADREAQSTTRSLGEKFGMPGSNQGMLDDGPLTLAESIKRKVSESQKLSPLEEDDQTGSQSELTPPPAGSFARPQIQSDSGSDDGWSAPVTMPTNKQPVKLGGFQPQPPAGGSGELNWAAGVAPSTQETHGSAIGLSAPTPSAAPAAAPANAPGGSLASPIGLSSPGSAAGSAIGLAPQAKQTKDGTTDWGGWSQEKKPEPSSSWSNMGSVQPQASSSAPAAPIAPATAAAQPQGGGGDWGSGWSSADAAGRPPLKSSDSWAQPGAEGATSWGQASGNAPASDPWASATPAPAPSPVPAPSPAAQTASSGTASASNLAAQPSDKAWGEAASWSAPKTETSGPASSTPDAGGWGQAPKQDTGIAGWGGQHQSGAQVQVEPAAAPAWGSAASPTPEPAPGWGSAPATAAIAADPATTGWGAAPATPATATAATAPAPAPRESGTGWGSTPAPAQATSASGWGGAPQTEAAPASSGWGASPAPATTNEPGGGWGNAPAPAAPAPEAGGWAATAPAQAAASPVWNQAPAAGSDGWAQGGNQAWGQAPQAPAPVTPAPEAKANTGWGQPASNQQADQIAQSAKPQGFQKRSWATAEPDLIETGTFRAFSPGGDALGAKPTPLPVAQPAMPAAAPQAPPADRWDVPIQERMKQEAQAAPTQGFGSPPVFTAAQPPAQAPVQDRWDVPIQERAKMQEAGSSQVPAATPAQAAPAPANPIAGNAIPVNQIVEKMGQVLSSQLPAQQAEDSRWDVPIQERVKSQDSMPVTPAPAQTTGWGEAPAQPAWNQPPASGWNQAPAPQTEPAAAGGGWPQNAPKVEAGWTQQGGNETAWGAPSSPAQAPAQQSGWGAPEAAPVPGPAPAQQSGWGAAQPAPQPVPQQAAPVARAGEITDKGKAGGLFNIDDSAIDQIFGGIGVKEPVNQTVVNTGQGQAQESAQIEPVQQSSFAPPQGQPAEAPRAPEPQPAQVPAQPAAQAPQPKTGLFQLDDSEVDNIFNNIGVSEPSVPVAKQEGAASFAPPATAPAPAQAAQPASQAAPSWGQAQPAPATTWGQPPAAPTWSAPAQTPSAPAATEPAPTGWGAPAQTPAAVAPTGWGAPAQAPAPVAPTGWGAPAQAPAPDAPTGWGAPAQAPAPDAPTGWGSPAQPAAPAAPGSPPGPANLFSVDDKVMNRIFSDGENQDKQDQAMSPPPKIMGIGRLDAGTDNSQEAGSGRIAAIGKFLLDSKDLDKIGKLTNSDPNEGKLRILTMEASQDLQALLDQIGTQKGVLGSVIVGHDGLLIANTMPGDMDAESVGVWALGVYMNTQHVTNKMGHDRVHQVVSRTPKGYVVIADFGGGLLVTLTEGSDTDNLIPLMRTITLLVN